MANHPSGPTFTASQQQTESQSAEIETRSAETETQSAETRSAETETQSAETRSAETETQSAETAYKVVKGMLRASEVTKTGQSSNATETIRLRAHADFQSETLQQRLKDSRSVDELLQLEQDLMIQVERLEAIERVAESHYGKPISRKDLRKILIDKERQAKNMFTALLKDVKKADRKLETQVRAFEAFLKEARISEKPQVGKNIFVLNADPEDLIDNPKITKIFPSISKKNLIRDEVFGLWVLGVAARQSSQVAGIGAQAKAHSAVAIVNVDTGRLPTEARLDALGQQARRGTGGYIQTAAEHVQLPHILEADDLDWITDVVGDKPGMENAVVCFSPIRMREQTAFDNDAGDIVIPSSYAYGGKLFYLAMVSTTEGIATSPSQSSDEHKLGDYGVAGAYGPFLYRLEGSLDLFKQWPIITGQLTGGHESKAQMRRNIASFQGQNTARGTQKTYQLTTTLAYEYLRRLMAILSPGMEGKPQVHKSKIIQRTRDFLVANLVGPEATKPFSKITVEEDTTSPEAAEVIASGGIRLIVKPTGKLVIDQVSVAIMPSGE